MAHAVAEHVDVVQSAHARVDAPDVVHESSLVLAAPIDGMRMQVRACVSGGDSVQANESGEPRGQRAQVRGEGEGARNRKR